MIMGLVAAQIHDKAGKLAKCEILARKILKCLVSILL
jgi:hypothetical protein